MLVSCHDRAWLLAIPLLAISVVMLGSPWLVAQPIDGDRLFDSARLLEVEIKLPEQDWATLCLQTRGRGGFASMFSNTSAKPFTYFRGDITIDGQKVASVGIRKKGFIGSLDDTRPSLKISFDEFIDQQPVQGLDRLTLNNNKQDTALVSQYLTYKVFNAAGVHAPRCSFAKVTVNGEYLGIYSNVESVRKPFLKARYGDGSGNLYEGTLADFYPPAVDKLEAKTGTKAEEDPDVRRLAELLAADEALPMDEIEKLVDVDAFLKFWAVESLLGFWDGYTQNQNNFFVYDNPQNGKFYFMPWGADGCFTSGGGPFGGFGEGPSSSAVRAESMLANRLFHSDPIPARYKHTMLEILKSAWDEDALVAEVDRIEQLTTGKLHEHQRDGGDGFRFGGRSLTMDGIRDFIRSRREQVLRDLESWPAEVPEQPRSPMHVVELGSIRASIATQWSETPSSSEAGTAKDVQFQWESQDVPLRDLTVVAQPMQNRGFGPPGGRGPGGSGRGPGGRRGRGGPGPGAFGGPMASIAVSGVRATDGETVVFTLMVDADVLAKRPQESVPVSGALSIGEPQGFGFGPPPQMLQGELKLTKSGTQSGDAIEGQIDLRIVEMRGGMMDRFRGGGGGRPGEGRRPGGGPPRFQRPE